MTFIMAADSRPVIGSGASCGRGESMGRKVRLYVDECLSIILYANERRGMVACVIGVRHARYSSP